MSAVEELSRLVAEKSRRVFVVSKPLDLSSSEGQNSVYVLQLPTTAPGAAGGRVGGVGERKIVKLYSFKLAEGRWMKVYETDNEEKLGRLELPYHAAGLTVILPDRTERTVSGVIDEEFVRMYDEAAARNI